jgi:hypothetical protein
MFIMFPVLKPETLLKRIGRIYFTRKNMHAIA